MPRRAGVEIAADFDELAYTMGIISGMAKTVKTKRYLSDVVEYVHSELSQDFDQFMDAQRSVAPERFHHVYDWGAEDGRDLAEKRLWGHKLIGQGGQRNATWVWKASRTPVPSPLERASNPDDPISLVPREELEKLSKRTYYFYWKAPIMEYNTPVNIEPRWATMLFIPTGDASKPFVFSRGTRVTNPGGQATTGAFSAAWTQYWGGPANKTFEDRIAPVLENDAASVKTGIRTGVRSRTGTIGIMSTAQYDAAFEAGERWSEEQLYKKSTAYKRRTRRNNAIDR